MAKLIIELKKDANAELILNYLFKNTDLQVNYNFNMVAIVNRRPKQLGILEILDAFIAHQKDVILRRTRFDLNKAKENSEKFLDEFMSNISDEIEKTVKIEKDTILVNIDGQEVGMLIGYRGETLYALQTLITSIANKGVESRVILRLDIENYKEKREKTLENLALRTAQTVMRTGRTITLEPMQAYERKIIHSFLQENPKVETRSIGQEPRRRIVISKK